MEDIFEQETNLTVKTFYVITAFLFSLCIASTASIQQEAVSSDQRLSHETVLASMIEDLASRFEFMGQSDQEAVR
ncbi:MAG: hypothetical protein K8S27_12025 [Candidatus Omnitrophica bacterium]|nr:hypothetical protein [Candidatus Omnitrophota bacterium]